MIRTLLLLLRKEFILFRNDPFLPKVSFIFPCMVILIIPLVTTMDVRHVGVAVVNRDHSRLSRDIMTDMTASQFFTVTTMDTYSEALESVKRGDTDVILELPQDFQKDLENGIAPAPHISANGVNGIKGTLGAQYVSRSVTGTISRFMGVTLQLPVTVDYLYNPTLEYRNNMIPALMIMLLVMICGFLPALNLVNEKETGTIEQMNVSPVRTWVFVLSKVMPYWLIGIIDLSLAMLIAALAYHLAPIGSLSAIYAAAILFVLIMSGIGIVIANRSERMSQSMLMMFFIVVIFVLMSGLFTPISSMPAWARAITYALPPRYFIEIMRSVYLKGTLMSELGIQYAALAAFALLTNVMGALTYSKRR